MRTRNRGTRTDPQGPSVSTGQAQGMGPANKTKKKGSTGRKNQQSEVIWRPNEDN